MEQDFANAREEIAKVIKQVQRYGTDASFIMQKKQDLESLMTRQKDTQWNVDSLPKVRKGDWVIVKRLSLEPVQVVEEMNSKGEFRVLFGTVRVKVSRKEAKLVASPTIQKQRENKQPKKKQTQQSFSSVRTKWNTIDVRGCRVEEAIAKIENELGRNAEMDTYFIIHGFGPLRLGLRQYFHKHPWIREMKDADIENGGQGVTILYLFIVE